VVHLVGDMTGPYPGERALSALLAKYPDLPTKLAPLGATLKKGGGVSYTQWEAWLALYHGKLLLIARAAGTAERGPKHAPTDGSRTAQDAHLARLRAVERYPGCTFTGADSLAKYVLSGAILDLLSASAVQAYAEEVRRDRNAAEGFIHEMAKKVAGDQNLDFEGKKQAVRNAIDLYQREISGDKHRPISTRLLIKRWQERGRWPMPASPVWRRLRYAGRPRQCAARRKNAVARTRNAANDMSRE
jgi:hypothetical protein